MVGLRKQLSVSIKSKKILNIKKLRNKVSKGKRSMLAETVQKLFTPEFSGDMWDTLEVSVLWPIEGVVNGGMEMVINSLLMVINLK